MNENLYKGFAILGGDIIPPFVIWRRIHMIKVNKEETPTYKKYIV